MTDHVVAASCGEIALSNLADWVSASPNQENRYLLPLPATNVGHAKTFLEGLGGTAVGAGRAMNQIGINAPLIRDTYKREVEGMISEISRKLKAGEPKEAVARWASAERNRIIARARSGSGMITKGMYEIRDLREYGRGGRNWPSIERRFAEKGLLGEKMYDKVISGAQKSNVQVNEGVMKGASYLKHGGRVVLVVGVSITAARIWNATEKELPKVIVEELGGYIGGGVGAGAGVGLCLLFGIATSGWGLVACGVVGGVGGGVAGSYGGGRVADGVYYTNHKGEPMPEVTIEIPLNQLHLTPPIEMCGFRR